MPLAEMRANSVPGVFSVENDLQVANCRNRKKDTGPEGSKGK